MMNRLVFRTDHYGLNKQAAPLVITYLSSYTYLRDWCRDRYPGMNNAFGSGQFHDNCALAYINEGGKFEPRTGSLFDHEKQIDAWALKNHKELLIPFCIFFLCLGLNYKRVVLTQRTVILLIWLINVPLGCVYLGSIDWRYGAEYVAYI